MGDTYLEFGRKVNRAWPKFTTSMVEAYHEHGRSIPEHSRNMSRAQWKHNMVASQVSNEVWFTNLDLQNANSQLSLDNFTSSQCNFSVVGEDITCTYLFSTGSYGLGGMPNQFQRIMDSTTGNIP